MSPYGYDEKQNYRMHFYPHPFNLKVHNCHVEFRGWFKYETIYSKLDLIIPSYAIGYFPSLIKSILHSQDGQFV